MNYKEIGEMIALFFAGISAILVLIGIVEAYRCIRIARSVQKEINDCSTKYLFNAKIGKDIADKTFLNH